MQKICKTIDFTNNTIEMNSIKKSKTTQTYPAVTFIAFVLTVPLLFSDRPLRMISYMAVFVIIFCIIVAHIKEEIIALQDIVNAVLFGVLSGVLSTYMMNVKCKRHLYEIQALKLSRTDILTGLQNRNAFEKSLDCYPAACRDNLTCVYLDVNGLHELNNTKGHEAGDEMIKTIGNLVREQFGSNHSFRIGGDEFVAFAPDCSPEDLISRIEYIISEAEKRSYYLSVGHAVGNVCSLDINELIRQAECNMYADKEGFYRETGRSIRRS